ncbi:hypothetical protein Pfo_001878, partial [Paulownia fortunei]
MLSNLYKQRYKMVRTRGESSSGARAQRNETPIPVNDRDTMINRLTELIERQSEQIQQLIRQRDNGEQPRVEVNQQRADYIYMVGERFRRLDPPTFEDAIDP